MRLYTPVGQPAISVPLGLGHSITVRPISPDDIDLETEFDQNLSQQSRYNRFLGGGIKPTPEWLEKLVRVDFSRDMALIATVTIEDRETQIGVARYFRLKDGISCEFAVAVADTWQGCGVGRQLLQKLIECARASGIERIEGDVLSTNRAMLGLASRLGFRILAHPDGAELKRVAMELRPEGRSAAAFQRDTSAG